MNDRSTQRLAAYDRMKRRLDAELAAAGAPGSDARQAVAIAQIQRLHVEARRALDRLGGNPRG